MQKRKRKARHTAAVRGKSFQESSADFTSRLDTGNSSSKPTQLIETRISRQKKLEKNKNLKKRKKKKKKKENFLGYHGLLNQLSKT